MILQSETKLHVLPSIQVICDLCIFFFFSKSVIFALNPKVLGVVFENMVLA
jgi:hypothetical protein